MQNSHGRANAPSGKYRTAKHGMYRLKNPQKYVNPFSDFMQSTQTLKGQKFVQFKSSLEYRAFKYADYNKHVQYWSVEPFAIEYIKPTDGKIHRYFPDMLIQMSDGTRFIIEIKSSGETVQPTLNLTEKYNRAKVYRYQEACQTFAVNSAKWAAAKAFADKHNCFFTVLTEKELP